MKIGPGVVGSAVLTGMVVTLLAGLFVLALPPVYVAKATVRAEPHQVLLLQSGQLIAEVISSTDSSVLSALVGWDDRLLGQGSNREALLAERVSIQAAGEDGWFDILVKAHQSDEAGQLANSLAAAFLRQARSGELSGEKKRSLMAEVESIEGDIAALFDAEPWLVEAARYGQVLEEDRRNLVQLVDAGNRVIRGHETDRESVQRGELGGLTDPGVVRAISQLNGVVQREAETRVRYGPGHHKMQAIAAEKSAAENLLDAALVDFRKRLDVEIDRETRLLTQRRKEIEKLDARLRNFLSKQAEAESLRMKRESALAVYRGETDPAGEALFARARVERHNTGSGARVFLVAIFLATSLSVGLLLARFDEQIS